jgi:hypothetical protein
MTATPQVIGDFSERVQVKMPLPFASGDGAEDWDVLLEPDRKPNPA